MPEKVPSLLLRNGIIHMPAKEIKGDLVIRNGVIIAIESHSNEICDTEIDCTGLHILPGLIDTHVHLRDPGLTTKEDFFTGTCAATAGGVTTVLDMPNTAPSTTTMETLEQKRQIAREKAVVNYGFFLGVTRNNYQKIGQFKNLAGLKIFYGSSTGDLLFNHQQELEQLFQSSPHLIAVHAEDENIIELNRQKYKEQTEPQIHSRIRGREAEIRAVEKILKLAQKYQTRLHFCHISTQEAVDLIAKFKLPNVTAEVTPHHLFLNETAYQKWGNFVKTNPPLRTDADNLALRQGFKQNILQTIATDHAPHLKAEKERIYAEAPSGIPGLELTLPLLLEQVNQGNFTLSEIIRWTAENPAKIFRIPRKGKIQVGYDADLAIVNLKQKQTILGKNLFTKCHWTPWESVILRGKLLYTIVNGRIVFNQGKIATDLHGKEVEFSICPSTCRGG